jgi:hypothetical protein
VIIFPVLLRIGQFQATKAEKEETRQMLDNINGSLEANVAEKTLNSVFEALRPKLDEQLTSMPKPETAAPAKREMDDMVAEILALGREGARYRVDDQVQRALERNLATFQQYRPSGGIKLSKLVGFTVPAYSFFSYFCDIQQKHRGGGISLWLSPSPKSPNTPPLLPSPCLSYTFPMTHPRALRP